MYIIQFIPDFSYGGAETMCANLAVDLKKMGNKVAAISLYNVETSITERLKLEKIPLFYLGKKKGLDLFLFFRLYSLLANEKPDVVHAHLYASKYVFLLAILLGIKCKVYTIHNEAQMDGSKIDHFINRLFFSFFNVIPVALSSDLIKSIADVYGGRNAKRTKIVFNGIPLDRCVPVETYSEKARLFLHIGSFKEAKNHTMLIKAFVLAHKRQPDIELFMYGDGLLKNKMEELVDNLHANSYIHFCGITSNAYSVMSKFDVFLLPSLWEGLPMTLIEAMGTGLPIITTRVGGIPTMLKNGESAIFCELSVDDLADKIFLLYNDVGLRKLLGLNAKKQSLQFSSKTMALNYCSIYRSMLKKGN